MQTTSIQQNANTLPAQFALYNGQATNQFYSIYSFFIYLFILSGNKAYIHHKHERQKIDKHADKLMNVSVNRKC